MNTAESGSINSSLTERNNGAEVVDRRRYPDGQEAGGLVFGAIISIALLSSATATLVGLFIIASNAGV